LGPSAFPLMDKESAPKPSSFRTPEERHSDEYGRPQVN
jgi:hypothetical protein